MKLNLNLGQGLAQQQQLNLAPQLLQWLRLLQVPAQQLEQMIQHELEINPALELIEEEERPNDAEELVAAGMDEDGTEARDPIDERMEILMELGREWDGDEGRVSAADSESSQERMDYRMNALTGNACMRDQLMKQIAMMGLSDAMKQAATFIIGTLDDRGYLDIPIAALAEECGVAVTVLEEALHWVQACEPAGIGARDLTECLLLQLPAEEQGAALARRIVATCIESVAQGRMEAIADHLDVELEDVEEAVAAIRGLNPYPGQVIEAETPVVTVTPDVILSAVEGGGFEIEIVERYVPRLRISHACRAMIEKGNLSRSDLAYVRARVRAAMFLIEGLRKREATLRRISEEIIRVQRRFLRGEEKDIRPLTMAKVAAIIGVHDTTVSRALAEKYIQTPTGLFPMKHFFQIGYQCEDGSALTPEMVRRRIERIILDESPTEPVKDEDIADLLQKDGIPVARRTVAKYRGELGIGSSKERAVRGPARPTHQPPQPPAPDLEPELELEAALA